MKFLIVDDHPVVRQGLAALLKQYGADTAVIEAGSSEQALNLASSVHDIDMVILDLVLPGMSGSEAIAAFGQLRPDLPVVVLSSSESPSDARTALMAGALGYVPKSASHATLLSAIRTVMDGEIYVPPLVLGDRSVRQGNAASGETRGQILTERQIEVLRRLSVGQPNKIIARELDLSEKTVKAHITAIFKALNVVNRTQAAAAGRERGIF